MEHLTSLYGVLFEYFGGETFPNSAELMSMYGRVSQSKSFKISPKIHQKSCRCV